MSTTTTKTKIFFTGATGYIGGAVLERLLQHPDAQNFDITLLVRNPEKANKFKNEFGLNAVVGNLSDVQLLEDLTSDADVIFNTADVDALDATKTMLRGSKRKFQVTGSPQIFIHTSGTGLFSDDAAGLRTTDAIWDDFNPEQLEQLPPTVLHRNVDLELIQADKEGYVRTYIIAPSAIYGMGTGRLFDAGLSNKFSTLLLLLLNTALKRGEVGILGKGVNTWPNVHIDDNLYIVLYNSIKTSPEKVGHGREGYYFGIADEFTYLQFGKELARVLVELGKTTNLEPTAFTPEEIRKYFNGSTILGSNSRGIANRSRSIGWNPTRFTKDLIASVRPDVEVLIRSSADLERVVPLTLADA